MFQFNDGGRAAAGFRGEAGDCVTRAIAIATEQPYQDVYAALNGLAHTERVRPGRALFAVGHAQPLVPHDAARTAWMAAHREEAS